MHSVRWLFSKAEYRNIEYIVNKGKLKITASHSNSGEVDSM
jgi:hypothetical protein